MPPGPLRPSSPRAHRPYRLVQRHLETYLALACEDEADGHAVPGYVERKLRRYLECGILAYGFARARCPECGHDFLVAFSCKGRGVCPSCNARRMGEPRPNVQWTFAAGRTTGQEVRAGGCGCR